MNRRIRISGACANCWLIGCLFILAAGCGHLSQIEVTSLNLSPAVRYEVDVLEVYDERMAAELGGISNGQWFREKRKDYLTLNRANKFFTAHSFLYQQGKPIKVSSKKKSKTILVFYRSNNLVADESKPEQFPSNKKILISLDKRNPVNLVTPQR
jgi:hypothetical protein